MDEIFAAGDAQFVQKSLNRLHEMFDKAHILILVSHSEKHILNICNKAIVLNKGELVKQGSTPECVDYYMQDIVKDATWTGAEQWIIDPLSFKDRKIIERLSAAHALEYKPGEIGGIDETGDFEDLEDITDIDGIKDYLEQSSFEPFAETTLATFETSEEAETGLTEQVEPRSDILLENSGLGLGKGWYAVERFDGDTFRWANNDSEVTLPNLAEHRNIQRAYARS